ncbi:hypothetical protein GNI_156520 [Gregarina niphandrodes]|uniref:Uncharacterized protein n=1 Tax=Gregarina niphandrodes TaxID=110365 RepID=A0A023AZH7_GRENI|nr:hypothetical protein GNI_156520 [Gregarina niphandrodes]EZG43884.1 hypothetical protein GNI_156520 [Gregarina niphandrodes]|eukprot:XP_011132927.1 hypothetical protein GNI_156520 [Gregarina niphandrodes]
MRCCRHSLDTSFGLRTIVLGVRPSPGFPENASPPKRARVSTWSPQDRDPRPLSHLGPGDNFLDDLLGFFEDSAGDSPLGWTNKAAVGSMAVTNTYGYGDQPLLGTFLGTEPNPGEGSQVVFLDRSLEGTSFGTDPDEETGDQDTDVHSVDDSQIVLVDQALESTSFGTGPDEETGDQDTDVRSVEDDRQIVFVDRSLEGGSFALPSNILPVGDSVRPIVAHVRSFEIATVSEKRLALKPLYLTWAHSILSRGWGHLAPFEVEGLSVFGLAARAEEWERAGRENVTLSACPLTLSVRGKWTEKRFRAWLEHGQPTSDSIRKRRGRSVSMDRVDEAVRDVVETWPVSGPGSRSFNGRMRAWWCNKGAEFAPPPGVRGVRSMEFYRLVIEKLGGLGVPIAQVPKAMRREWRRHRIREAAVLHGLPVSDDLPPHLVCRSGRKFQIATAAEANLRIESPYLVWAYDVLHHGWWGLLPPALLCSSLSVFGLAAAAREWVRTREAPSTLNADCYCCTETGIQHSISSCERCEAPWSTEEFWEWLRARHPSRTLHLSLGRKTPSPSIKPPPVANVFVLNTRSDVEETINAVGFDSPRVREDERSSPSVTNEWDFGDFRSLRSGFRKRVGRWWAGFTKPVKEGLERWEFERVMLYQFGQRFRQRPAATLRDVLRRS